MPGHQVAQLGDDRPVTSVRKLEVDALLGRGQIPLDQPRRLDVAKPGRRYVVERRPAPQRQRLHEDGVSQVRLPGRAGAVEEPPPRRRDEPTGGPPQCAGHPVEDVKVCASQC